MRTRTWRVGVAVALLAPLLVSTGGADATSTALSCPGLGRLGPFQSIPVEPFRGVEGVQTRDVVTGYAVDERRPQRVLATNGNTVKTSGSYGCAWEDGLVLDATPDDAIGVSGATSTILGTALLPNGPALATIREGTGAASRAHVAVSDSGRRGTWRLSDQGLPPQGAPRLLRGAHDGRTAYLVLDPVNGGESSGGTLPGLPTVPGAASTGALYATTDGGRSWTRRTAAGAFPDSGIDALAVDVRDPDLLYAVAGSRLLISSDGGRGFRDAGFPFVRAVETLEPGEVAVAMDEDPATGVPQEDGIIMHSTDSGASFRGRVSVLGLRSLSYRRGDGVLLAEAGGRLYRIDARRDGRPERVQSPLAPQPGSTLGDRSDASSFTALADHALLRWVDLEAGVPQSPTLVLGDLAAPPPPPGRVDPPSRSTTMPVGESRLLDFTLVLPPSPTPLDLVFLVDTSPGMRRYIDDVRTNLRRITGTLVGAGVDVKVGLATAGPGPADGEPPYPEVDPTTPGYRKPALYRLLRPVGDVDGQLQQAFDGLRTDSAPQSGANRDVLEGQLVSLRELLTGQGVLEQGSPSAVPRYAVPPGQMVGFRPQQGIRRLVIHATDEPFNNPYGTPRKADGSPDLEGVGALLARNRVLQAGISPVEGSGAVADLRRMALLTGARAPEGGLDCTNDVQLQAGDPLVCQAAAGFSRVITDVVRSLGDRQDAAVVHVGTSPVLGAVEAGQLRALDVTRRNDVPFRVRVSCVDVLPGTFEQVYEARLRGFTVARALARVTCTPPAPAAVPPRTATGAQPAGGPAGQAQPLPQAPAPPVPAPPAVQPQTQPQAQSQVQTQAQAQAAAALQRQEQLQLALALSGDDEQNPGGQMAMVDRRRAEELRALALVSLSLAAASALGLARLRTSARPRLRGVRPTR